MSKVTRAAESLSEFWKFIGDHSIQECCYAIRFGSFPTTSGKSVVGFIVMLKAQSADAIVTCEYLFKNFRPSNTDEAFRSYENALKAVRSLLVDKGLKPIEGTTLSPV